MSALSQETVLDVHHWNDTLFSFTTTRDRGLRFKSGHFLMIGLEVEGRPLTSRLQHIRPGDPILVGRKPTGTLVINTLLPGRRLYLLATGTGLAPFMSIIRDPDTYERFEHVVVVHGVRKKSELGYAGYIRDELPRHELVGEQAARQLLYYPTVTREPFEHQGRITDLLGSGKITSDLGLPAIDPAEDRIMICGSPSMLEDLVELLEARNFREGSSHAPAQFTIERAFVER